MLTPTLAGSVSVSDQKVAIQRNWPFKSLLPTHCGQNWLASRVVALIDNLTAQFSALCRLLDYVDLTLCARHKPWVGVENVKATVYIIRNPSMGGRCCRGDTNRIIIAALPAPAWPHRKSMTDLAYAGSYPAPKIMLSMSLYQSPKSHITQGFQAMPHRTVHIIKQST